eukprot:GHVT01020865.1.p1 GENE.GHVT01020865.1~~GHVT01020865.1.p1  ORF type:complete len:310 (+),score=33.56 GHVT01020865.1:126-1055(+)
MSLEYRSLERYIEFAVEMLAQIQEQDNYMNSGVLSDNIPLPFPSGKTRETELCSSQMPANADASLYPNNNPTVLPKINDHTNGELEADGFNNDLPIKVEQPFDLSWDNLHEQLDNLTPTSNSAAIPEQPNDEAKSAPTQTRDPLKYYPNWFDTSNPSQLNDIPADKSLSAQLNGNSTATPQLGVPPVDKTPLAQLNSNYTATAQLSVPPVDKSPTAQQNGNYTAIAQLSVPPVLHEQLDNLTPTSNSAAIPEQPNDEAKPALIQTRDSLKDYLNWLDTSNPPQLNDTDKSPPAQLNSNFTATPQLGVLP